eukprot:6210634-Pleurochrysis_carterae.AAC.3
MHGSLSRCRKARQVTQINEAKGATRKMVEDRCRSGTAYYAGAHFSLSGSRSSDRRNGKISMLVCTQMVLLITRK